MSRVNSLIDQRTKKPSASSKMAAMAQRSAAGHLTSFSGVFSVSDLSDSEKELLAAILEKYGDSRQESRQDLEALISLTSEVKAIHNQAILLHGERIQKAHQILTRYRTGAFTRWLMAAYGNRQTPYNLLQYYEFYESLPHLLRPRLELMPRQAVYVLASRTGNQLEKERIVAHYQGENKAETLALIREAFPLNRADKRGLSFGKKWLKELKGVQQSLRRSATLPLTSHQKREALDLLQEMVRRIEAS